MKTKIFLLCAASLLLFTLGTSFVSESNTDTMLVGSADPRSGESIEMTLSCPDCNQLMKGSFRYCNNATTTVICPKCHKHWLVHYDWVRDPKSGSNGHWQYMLRILSIKKS